MIHAVSHMIIVLNGPLGIGKSTLAEALADSIDRCVMLDGIISLRRTDLHPTSLNICIPRSRFSSSVIGASAISTSSSIIFRPHRLSSTTCAAGWQAWTTTSAIFLPTLPTDENLRHIQHRASVAHPMQGPAV